MELDLLNRIHPYVGNYHSEGMDAKNRLPIPNPLIETFDRRRKVLGLDDRIMYYSLETPDDSFLILRDSIIDETTCPYFFPKDLDSQNRITIRPEVADKIIQKRNLIYVGFGDHIRVYHRPVWESSQKPNQPNNPPSN